MNMNESRSLFCRPSFPWQIHKLKTLLTKSSTYTENFLSSGRGFAEDALTMLILTWQLFCWALALFKFFATSFSCDLDFGMSERLCRAISSQLSVQFPREVPSDILDDITGTHRQTDRHLARGYWLLNLFYAFPGVQTLWKTAFGE